MARTLWAILVRLSQTFWEFTRDRDGWLNNLSRPHPQKIHVQKRPTPGPPLLSSPTVISAHAVSSADQTSSHYVLQVTSTFKAAHTHCGCFHPAHLLIRQNSYFHIVPLTNMTTSPPPHLPLSSPKHAFSNATIGSHPTADMAVYSQAFAMTLESVWVSHTSIIPHEDPL
jgi:hypothetical protein